MKKGSRFRPMLEVLEERTNPSSTVQYNGTDLTVLISNNGANTIAITQTAPDVIDVLLDGANDLGSYSVTGNLKVQMGNSTSAAGVIMNLNLGGFNFDGNVTLVVGNTLSPGFSNVLAQNGSVGGDLNITTGNGDDTVVLGFNLPLSVDGSVNINTNASVNDQVLVGVTDTVTIDGNLQVNNAVSFQLASDSTVGGLLNANSSTKTAGFFFSVDAGTTIGKDALLTTGAGTSDTVTLNGSVAGNAIVNQTNGTNEYNFGGAVAGNMTYLGGTGVDNGTITGQVLGNLTVYQNNGANTVTFGAGSAVLGTNLTITGGTGADSVNFAGLAAPGARLNASLGNGNDTVAFTITPVLFSAFIDGGAGTNVFIPGTPVTYPFTKKNF